jgi:hypothetical protein
VEAAMVRWPDRELEKAKGEIEQTNQMVKHSDINQRIHNGFTTKQGTHHGGRNPRNHLTPPNSREADGCEMKTKTEETDDSADRQWAPQVTHKCREEAAVAHIHPQIADRTDMKFV